MAGLERAGVTFCDESDGGFGWIAPEPPWMQRASHALAADGGVWLVDPTDFPASTSASRRSASRAPCSS